MQYRKLGNSDLEVSTIGMGCWQFAGGKMWGEQEERDSKEAVDAALNEGINLFDTAEGYGKGSSEEVLGRALKGRREKAIIATKSSGPTYAPEELKKACEGSLKRLDTDYIDLYQLHWPRQKAVPHSEILEGVKQLQKEGKIRFFGVCNYGPGDLAGSLPAEETEPEAKIVSNQLAYSLLWRSIEYEVVPICQAHNIGILTYSTLVHGLLSGKYLNPDNFPRIRARTLHFSGGREEVRHGQEGQEELTFRTIQKIKSICDDAGIDMVTASFGWAANQPGITSVLAGARNADQIKKNAAAGSYDFPKGFFEKLTRATSEIRRTFGGHLDMWEVPGRIS